jgi:hypothetical protein
MGRYCSFRSLRSTNSASNVAEVGAARSGGAGAIDRKVGLRRHGAPGDTIFRCAHLQRRGERYCSQNPFEHMGTLVGFLTRWCRLRNRAIEAASATEIQCRCVARASPISRSRCSTVFTFRMPSFCDTRVPRARWVRCNAYPASESSLTWLTEWSQTFHLPCDEIGLNSSRCMRPQPAFRRPRTPTNPRPKRSRVSWNSTSSRIASRRFSWPSRARKHEGQQKARLTLLEHLLEGQPPITEGELSSVRKEWLG